jgi:hypothetical protein
MGRYRAQLGFARPRASSTRLLLGHHLGRDVFRPHHAATARLTDQRINSRPGQNTVVGTAAKAQRAADAIVTHLKVRNPHGHVKPDLQHQLRLARECWGNNDLGLARIEVNKHR